MRRFITNHNATLRERFVLPDGRALSFDPKGLLVTDEAGGQVIRSHALYGRTILEVDESTSAPPAVVAGRAPAGFPDGGKGVQVDGRRRPPVSPEVLAAREAWARRKAEALEYADALRKKIDAAGGWPPREVPFAERWLLEELRRGGGKMDAAPTIARARAAGITAKQLRMARERLLVQPVKRGWKDGWRWVLFEEEA